MNKQKLLQVRKVMKSKKPEFERQQANYKSRFEGQWRKPRGLHSKRRRQFKGHAKMPSIGYSSPAEVRGLNKKGLMPIAVSNVNDLQKVKADCVAVISSTVGLHKRIMILNKIKEMKLNVSGIKNIDAYIIGAREDLGNRKKDSQARKEEKKKRLEIAEKKEEKKSAEKKHDHDHDHKHDHDHSTEKVSEEKKETKTTKTKTKKAGVKENESEK